jgi:hypothetical protein
VLSWVFLVIIVTCEELKSKRGVICTSKISAPQWLVIAILPTVVLVI